MCAGYGSAPALVGLGACVQRERRVRYKVARARRAVVRPVRRQVLVQLRPSEAIRSVSSQRGHCEPHATKA